MGLGMLSLLAAPAARADSGFVVFVPTGPSAGDTAALEAACAKPNTKECTAAQEGYAAFSEYPLLRAAESGDPKYKPLARTAAALPFPGLQAAAAAALGNLEPDAKDTQLLTELLNHPVPKVRHAALRALGGSSDEKARPLLDRARDDQGESTSPDTVPTEKSLGVPLPPGASYLYFASAPAQGRADFVTGESLDKVSAFYAGRFGTGLTLKQFEKKELARQEKEGMQMDAKQVEQMQKLQQEAQQAMMAAMQAGKSPQEAAAEMQRRFAEFAPFDVEGLMSAFDRPEQLDSVRVFVAEKAARTGKPVRLAVVYKDLALGKTGVSFITPPPGQ
ncbi:HEAT repeat domain-containing protein [Pyxidicoccus parkwayensis]|uniref:HEAT repeat domain-containing protein n=1 Tax=Pyxidicoccus parkwayensis TaxID=2813578 RepID=A0ABX7P7I2_9BACT|nr:HEAT repeat domain-containing protein [Pyxidicoccus parkwaysis]QSQ26420.1 HEAT repeat domain-containing protein [Pyxidicoccus parkwaysis]